MNSLMRASKEVVGHWYKEEPPAPGRKQEIYLEAMHNQITKSVDIILSDEHVQDALVHIIQAAHQDFVKHGPAGRQSDDPMQKAETDRIWHCCYLALQLLTQCTFTLDKGYQFSISMYHRHVNLVQPKKSAVLVDLIENQTRNELIASEALGLMNAIERAEAEANFRVSYERMLLEVQQALAAEEQQLLAQWVPGAVRAKCQVNGA